MESQRLDKYLKRILPSCPSGLLYKQLRNKNITLNDKKASGNETIKEGDVVKIWFSDDTFKKFSESESPDISRYTESYNKYLTQVCVLQESKLLGFVIFNKPAGMLSQSDKSGDYSINDYLIGYLLALGIIDEESLKTSKPSICNRLDRNTSGIIFCSINLKGVRFYNSYIRGEGEKHYLALVKGRFDKDGIYEDYVIKDEKENKLIFTTSDDPDAMDIKTGFSTVIAGDDISLVKVRLYTGRSHQIRSHLSHLGFPIIGDPKYGGMQNKYDAKRQMLHAYELSADTHGRFGWLNVTAPIPEDMRKICISEFGPPEDYLK